MKFKQAKDLSNVLYTIATIALLAALFVMENGTAERTLCIIAAVVVLIAGAAVRAVWCVCPNCGEHVSGQLRVTKECPNCGKPLVENKRGA